MCCWYQLWSELPLQFFISLWGVDATLSVISLNTYTSLLFLMTLTLRFTCFSAGALVWGVGLMITGACSCWTTWRLYDRLPADCVCTQAGRDAWGRWGRNLVMYRHSSWEKDCGFTPSLHFNPVFTKFNFTEFLHTSLHQRICSTSRELVSMVSVW